MRLSQVPIIAAVAAFLGGAAVETLRERDATREETRHTVPRPSGRSVPDAESVHAPHGSVWPATVGGALALMAFGVVTSYAFAFVGLGLLIIGIIGWVEELRNE